MKKKWIIVGAALLALLLFLWSPFSHYPLSLAVMRVYSGVHQRDSLAAQKEIELTLSGGAQTPQDDWYPFVMTFNAGPSFSAFVGEEDLELSVLYNFPAFDRLRGCSRLFDPHSPYYSSFYGAYLVSGRDGEGNPYGFTAAGRLDVKKAAEVPQFDYQRLVLADFGAREGELIFDWSVESVEEDLFYAGSEGWTRVDADLTTNGAGHEAEGFCRSYLQYGVPAFVSEEDREPFQPIQMKGRVYGKYFPQWETGIFFYVMAADETVLEDCDREILSAGSVS